MIPHRCLSTPIKVKIPCSSVDFLNVVLRWLMNIPRSIPLFPIYLSKSVLDFLIGMLEKFRQEFREVQWYPQSAFEF